MEPPKDGAYRPNTSSLPPALNRRQRSVPLPRAERRFPIPTVLSFSPLANSASFAMKPKEQMACSHTFEQAWSLFTRQINGPVFADGDGVAGASH